MRIGVIKTRLPAICVATWAVGRGADAGSGTLFQFDILARTVFEDCGRGEHGERFLSGNGVD